MISNAVFVSSLLCLAAAMYVLSELAFLAPYRTIIVREYGLHIAAFSTVCFVNLFAVVYTVSRRLFLKDTGQKLAHIEKQLRTGSTISEDLSRQLEN